MDKRIISGELKRRLESSGLWRELIPERTNLPNFEPFDELFVELVFRDASKLPAAQFLMSQFREELRESGARFDYIVRAMWRVKHVEYAARAVLSSGQFLDGIAFRCTLVSGSRETAVQLILTSSGCDYFWKNILKRSGDFTWSDLSDDEKQKLHMYVKEFIILQLSLGGMSYWDPLLFPFQTLNDAGLAYLIGRSAAYRAMRAAIDDTLEVRPQNLLLQEFLISLSDLRTKIRNIDVALHHLPPEAFGGAYQPGDEFVTSASQIFPQLSRAESDLIRNHFLEKAEKLELTLPALVSKYPQVFARDVD
jgi:hypothetical protein